MLGYRCDGGGGGDDKKLFDMALNGYWSGATSGGGGKRTVVTGFEVLEVSSVHIYIYRSSMSCIT